MVLAAHDAAGAARAAPALQILSETYLSGIWGLGFEGWRIGGIQAVQFEEVLAVATRLL